MLNNNLQNEVKTASVGTVRRFVSEQFLIDYKESILDSSYATNSVVTSFNNGLMTKEDKVKLDGITNYIHPDTHPASMIIEDSSHRFMTDEEKEKLSGLENLELNAENISMSDGSSVETTITNLKSDVHSVDNSLKNIQNKVIDILIHLEMSNDSDISDIGYWYDPLTSDNNIVFIDDSLRLDVDRQRIFGSSGSVIFKKLNIPFLSDKASVSVTLDNNFSETLADFNAPSGNADISIEQYSYEVR